MTLLEALKILRPPVSTDAARFSVFLACGFTPLHLKTFLAAQLRQRLPGRQIEIPTGLYGDLAGSIDRFAALGPDAAAVVIEWEDLDPRLGFRQLTQYAPDSLTDVAESAIAQLSRLQDRLQAASETRIALCIPTLPLPPLAFTAAWQASLIEIELYKEISAFAHWAAGRPRVRIISPQHIGIQSSPAARYNIDADVVSGFPYTTEHASAIAEALALLVTNPTPKKGLITDLDNTFWSGIVGEIGVANVSWDLAHNSHAHGLYQQFLGALAQEGVLIAVASKNDPVVVREAFERQDLLVTADRIWPVAAQWGPKSESVRHILEAWNVAADSVVFIDDSPMELAEVQAAHPGIECILFPQDNYRAIYHLLQQLRTLFSKSAVNHEDAIRLQSLRAADESYRNPARAGQSLDSFLETAKARVALTFSMPPEPRALELLNKTNQFNLNGRRYTESEWDAYTRDPNAVVMVADYQDRYGPLGKIAVLAGKRNGRYLKIDAWVLSCRAFSRRIEHRCLEQLFSRFDLEEITFDYVETARNSPLREFFERLLGRPPSAMLRLDRATFLTRCPAIFSQVYESIPV